MGCLRSAKHSRTQMSHYIDAFIPPFSKFHLISLFLHWSHLATILFASFFLIVFYWVSSDTIKVKVYDLCAVAADVTLFYRCWHNICLVVPMILLLRACVHYFCTCGFFRHNWRDHQAISSNPNTSNLQNYK